MKQAVILIHGIGEQYPMETVRSFVKTMWHENIEIQAKHPHADKYFISQDDYLDNFDLRRITTSKNKFGVQTVFYEYYWAHLMQGNKVTHILKWLKRIIFANPFRLPPPLNIASLLFLAILGGLAVFLFWFNNILDIDSNLFLAIEILVIPLVISMVIKLLETYAGDAARYLDPSPNNVHVRQKIRKQGVQLLLKLKEKKYEKIILVGHSLGSVIAYDILKYAWASFDISYPTNTRLPHLGKIVDHLNEKKLNINLRNFQEKQWQAFQEQKVNDGDWLVSDLITIGSPLTYSQILLAKNLEEFDSLKEYREILTCPPELDNKKLTYTSKSENKRKMIDSSAFALTRWTNIYSSNRFLFYGDIVSGPLNNLFGKAIQDIDINEGKKPKFFDHTKYWENGKNTNRIKILRKALRLDELKSE